MEQDQGSEANGENRQGDDDKDAHSNGQPVQPIQVQYSSGVSMPSSSSSRKDDPKRRFEEIDDIINLPGLLEPVTPSPRKRRRKLQPPPPPVISDLGRQCVALLFPVKSGNMSLTPPKLKPISPHLNNYHTPIITQLTSGIETTRPNSSGSPTKTNGVHNPAPPVKSYPKHKNNFKKAPDLRPSPHLPNACGERSHLNTPKKVAPTSNTAKSFNARGAAQKNATPKKASPKLPSGSLKNTPPKINTTGGKNVSPATRGRMLQATLPNYFVSSAKPVGRAPSYVSRLDFSSIPVRPIPNSNDELQTSLHNVTESSTLSKAPSNNVLQENVHSPKESTISATVQNDEFTSATPCTSSVLQSIPASSPSTAPTGPEPQDLALATSVPPATPTIKLLNKASVVEGRENSAENDCVVKPKPCNSDSFPNPTVNKCVTCSIPRKTMGTQTDQLMNSTLQSPKSSTKDSNKTNYAHVTTRNIPGPVEHAEAVDMGTADESRTLPDFESQFPPLVATANATVAWKQNASECCKTQSDWVKDLTVQERWNKLRVNDYDIVFEVGPSRSKFTAHLVILAIACPNFRNKTSYQLSTLLKSQPNPYKYVCPDLEPFGVDQMLKYMYGENLEWEALEPAQKYSIAEAARRISYDDLEQKCLDSLQSGFSIRNAIDSFYLAVKKEDQRLKDLVMEFIQKHTWDIFFSDRFKNVPENALQCLLKSDDFYLEEKLIFAAVKIWATAKINLQKTEKPTGEQLRNALGSTLYLIRFPIMSTKEFHAIDREHIGLFTDAEHAAIMRYLFNRENDAENLNLVPKPLEFICTPRPKPASVKQEETQEQEDDAIDETYELLLPKVERHELVDEITISDENINFSSVDIENKEETVSEPLPISEANPSPPPNLQVNQVQPEDEADNPPKKKKRQLSGEDAINRNVDLDGSKVKTFQDLVRILNATDSDSIKGMEEIREEVKFRLPKSLKRLYLPNLKEFHLKFVLPNMASTVSQQQSGSAFKSSWKVKSASLGDILFFDKTIPSEANAENIDGNSRFLEELLSQKVNVTITATAHTSEGESADVMLLKINHEEGILIFNLIKDAQSIINGARNFPLKVLAASDCELTSLAPINTDLLEVIVMRRVKGLQNQSDFLRNCSSLREVSWNNLDGKEVNLFYSLLEKNKFLKKLSLAKCKIVAGGDILTIPPFTYVEELYLDNCSWQPDFVERLPTLFPFLKKIQMYGSTNDDALLLSILKIRSVQWILMWSLEYQFKKKTGKDIKMIEKSSKGKKSKKRKKEILSDVAQKAQTFLTGILGEKQAKLNYSTFVLERKSETVEAVAGTSTSPLAEWNPFNSANWTGQSYTNKEKYGKISEIDYFHHSYDKFYPTLEVFLWSDTSKKDLAIKQRKTVTNVTVTGDDVEGEEDPNHIHN